VAAEPAQLLGSCRIGWPPTPTSLVARGPGTSSTRRTIRCGFTGDPGHLAASACKVRHVDEPCFDLPRHRRSPGQGV